MLTILIRAILLYFILVLTMRAMGKRQLGQFQPYEFVMAMLIANLVATPMSDVSTPLLHGVLPVAALYGAHALITLLCMRTLSLRMHKRVISACAAIRCARCSAASPRWSSPGESFSRMS